MFQLTCVETKIFIRSLRNNSIGGQNEVMVRQTTFTVRGEILFISACRKILQGKTFMGLKIKVYVLEEGPKEEGKHIWKLVNEVQQLERKVFSLINKLQQN